MKNNSRYKVIKSLFFLLSVSLGIFFFNKLVDYIIINSGLEFLSFLYGPATSKLSDLIANWGEVVTGVMGIEITFIAIIVQLAANKYSSKIMELFIDNKVNYWVLSLYVISAINVVLVPVTFNEKFDTLFSLGVTCLLLILAIIVVIPHFIYTLNFLHPNYFISYVKKDSEDILKSMASNSEEFNKADKNKITENINFMGDIALNSVFQSDRAVTLLTINALREIVTFYIPLKSKMPKQWFSLTGEEMFDPDFSSYSSFVMKKIERDKIYLERKVFALYEIVFNMSRTTLRDVASGVLLNTELIASSAIKMKDKGAMECAFNYMNSYLRISISGRDPRSAFNTLEHYRIIGEELLNEDPQEVENISFFFKYYGQEANKNSVLFILETAAYDLCRLNEIAYEKGVPNISKLLELFLTLDEPLDDSKESGSSKELSLIGVRIAQTKLAGFYLLKGEKVLARKIFWDMRVEPDHRIAKIKEIIFNTTKEEFWEVTPRGVNFNYVSEERKNALKTFFDWFEEAKENSK